MFSHVNLQVVRLVENFLANLALVLWFPGVVLVLPEGSFAILHMLLISLVVFTHLQTCTTQRTKGLLHLVVN